MLFDWLVTGHVLDVNPAHAVRGPKYVAKMGKTPLLNADEARELLDSIKMVVKTEDEEGAETGEPAMVGLRDRALIGVMVYTFARINSELQMKVRDYLVQGRLGWVRLHEEEGKEHEVPCHHNLEQYLDEYIAAAGIAGNPHAPLFQTAADRTRTLSGKAMWQQDA
jgi:integrase/recombinase XerD